MSWAIRFLQGTAAMILPRRAPVSPRVVLPDTGETVLLDDMVGLHLKQGFRGAVELVGERGAGKTMALAHLASLPWAERLELVDDADNSNVRNVVSSDRLLVYTVRRALERAEWSYQLALWSDDEWIEYLLAAHPTHCASVMERLAGDDQKDLLGGVPQLCCVVAEAMARSDSIRDVSTALRHAVGRVLGDGRALEDAQFYAAAVLLDQQESAEKRLRQLTKAGFRAELFELLGNRLVQCLLTADRLIAVLKREAKHPFPTRRLPRDVVQEMARLAKDDPDVLHRLRQLMLGRDKALMPMVASVLHVADPDWRPEGRRALLLRGAYLDGADWEEIDLREVNLEEADLCSSNLRQANLKGAKLNGAMLRGSCLSQARLNDVQAWRTDFSGAALDGALLSGGRFPHSRFVGSRLDHVVAEGAIFKECDFGSACLRGAKLTGCDFQNATLEEADLEEANLSDAQLGGLCLRTTILTGADFARADLSRCDLESVKLPQAQFRSTLLSGALLTGSVMPAADFRGACLNGAALADIDWEGADLRDADLRGCSFHLGSSRSGLVGSPYAGHGSRTGFYTNDYEEQSYKAPEEIRKANLRGADLRGARVDNTDFYLVDLRDAKYDSIQAEHFRRCDAILYDRAE